MKEKREQVHFRLDKRKSKALRVKIAEQSTSVQKVMENKVDEYLKEAKK